ncbi:MAG: AI-2E family transporter [Clostridia bacterium]|nr:AI-2E family transporter [Clostridiales bacterium]
MAGRTRNVLIITVVSLLMLFIGIFFVKNKGVIWSILRPFIIGTVIAYVLNPMVEALTRRGTDRVAAVIVVYSVIVGAAVGILSFLLPSVYRETMKFMDILPTYAVRTKEYLDGVYLKFSRTLTPELREAIRNNIDYIQELTIHQINNLTNWLMAFFQGLVSWVIALVVSFYLLKDKDYFIALAQYLIPMRLRQDAAKISGEINRVLMGFIRGQLLVALVVGVLAIIGFLVIDLNFAILLGVITGLGDIIPYFGPIIGGVPVVLVGLMESPTKALWAVGVVVLIQQLESGIITPKIVGDSVGIHPVFIILSLLIAAQFFGLVGLFIAVPAAAIIKVLVLYVFDKTVNIIK